MRKSSASVLDYKPEKGEGSGVLMVSSAEHWKLKRLILPPLEFHRYGSLSQQRKLLPSKTGLLK